MHSPGPAELLHGVSEGLEGTVLPAVQDAAAQRQLRAALHILRRLERSWDRLPGYLRADAQDIIEFLGDGEPTVAPQATTAELIALHDDLERRLIAAEERGVDPAALRALQRRMLEREVDAWGT